MHVLVTGGAGFIGSAVVTALLGAGHEVRVLDALLPEVHAGGWPAALDPRAERVHGDVRDASTVDRALEGATGTTALHTCFGYAHVVHDRPDGYPFLAELADCAADVLAIEAAQSKLDPRVLKPIAGKTVIVGVLDLSTDEAETPEQVAARIEAALTVIPEERLQVGPDCGMKYLPRDLAFAKLRALVEGARLVTGR